MLKRYHDRFDEYEFEFSRYACTMVVQLLDTMRALGLINRLTYRTIKYEFLHCKQLRGNILMDHLDYSLMRQYLDPDQFDDYLHKKNKGGNYVQKIKDKSSKA